MEKIFSVQDRQNAFEFVLSAARENDRIMRMRQNGKDIQRAGSAERF